MFSKENFIEGTVLMFDKPLGWSSFKVVRKIRGIIQNRYKIKIKVGHAGTLDPLSTGLLILCTGKKTKKISIFQNQKKEYEATMYLGGTTPSYDLETKIDKTYSVAHIDKKVIREKAKNFIGKIKQKPPIFSAIKKNGQPLYKLAREGKQVVINEREVYIEKLEIEKIEMPVVQMKVLCSKGTYIRSLVNDFGKALQSGAYLSSLRRTKIGNYSIENAINFENFENNLN